jgi:hypothetical protein
VAIAITNAFSKKVENHALSVALHYMVDYNFCPSTRRCGFPPRQRVPFFVHVDEFQTFSSESFASLLSEARKFATHFCLANQYSDQLSHAVRAAVIGNAGTLVAERTAADELLRGEIGRKTADWGISVKSVEIRDLAIPVACPGKSRLNGKNRPV